MAIVTLYKADSIFPLKEFPYQIHGGLRTKLLYLSKPDVQTDYHTNMLLAGDLPGKAALEILEVPSL